MTTTMTAAPPLLQTTIGKKIAMASSGVILMLWLWAHMLGNLKLWIGSAQYDRYAHWLRAGLDPPFPYATFLDVIRAVTLLALAVHLYFAVVLSVRSKRARRTGYERTERLQANVASMTMRWGGLTILLFVIFHLFMFTWGFVTPGFAYHFGRPAQMVIGAFSVWWMVVVYTFALVALALHLYHASWSMFQTFGVNNRRWDTAVRRFAAFNSIALFLGFLSLPLGVISGAIH